MQATQLSGKKTSELGGTDTLLSPQTGNATAGQAGFRHEMAEGRPVVNIGGNSTHGSVASRDSFSRRGLRGVFSKFQGGKSRHHAADKAKSVKPKNNPRSELLRGRERLGALGRRGIMRSQSGSSRSGLDATTGFMSLGGGAGGGGGGWSSQGSGGNWSSRAPSPPPPPSNPLRSEAVQSAASKWLKRRHSSNAMLAGGGDGGGGGGGGGSGGGAGGRASASSSGPARGVPRLGLGVGRRGGGDSGAASAASSSRDVMAADTAKTVAMVESGDFEEDSGRGGKVWGEDGGVVTAKAAVPASAPTMVVAVVATPTSPPARSRASGSASSVPAADSSVPIPTLSAASEAAAAAPAAREEEEAGEQKDSDYSEEGFGVATASPATMSALGPLPVVPAE